MQSQTCPPKIRPSFPIFGHCSCDSLFIAICPPFLISMYLADLNSKLAVPAFQPPNHVRATFNSSTSEVKASLEGCKEHVGPLQLLVSYSWHHWPSMCFLSRA